MKMYEVGGCVRDEFLNQPSKDIDFSVVLDDNDMAPRRTKANKMFQPEPFDAMVDILRDRGFKIFLKTPEHLTVRAKFPTYSGHPGLIGAERRNLTADFVLARKEGVYTDGRRPDKVEPGTLLDDLARRDFTMNAIAKDGRGNYIDPHNGIRDIENRIIRAVGDPIERFTEDALRAVRAMRFSVTKDFRIDDSVSRAMMDWDVVEAVENNISDERIQVELSKMFRFSTIGSLKVLDRYPALTRAMFSGRISLNATLKTKGRNKA